MSKIICDICGTSYADTATQCPICGCVRPAQPQSVPDEETQSSGYTYVKGGRFSKSNVKKRTGDAKKSPKKDEGGKKGIVVILIAIILVGIIALGVILWATGILGGFSSDEGAPSTTPVTTKPSEPQDVPCEALTIANKQYTLVQIGDSALIDCRKVPADSTDVVTFVSENEAVATVDANGKVTAVQAGTTNIIITCGNVIQTCEIIVGSGVSPAVLVLKETVITFTKAGETMVIYDGPIPVEDIAWTSSNDYIASVSNGVVTANASGPATITATYMDKTATCEVLCDIESTGNMGGITEDGGNTGGIGEDGGNVTYELYASFGPLYYENDITVKAGEEFTLYLKSSAGRLIDVDWSCNENEYVSTEGGKIKALKKLPNDYITVRTVYENNTYTCKIRVS